MPWGPAWRETEQLAGAIVVDEPGVRTNDRILFAMRAGQRVRMRFINIQPETSDTFERVRDSLPVVWRPMAKDGYELPSTQAIVGPSQRTLWPGETFDAEFAAAAMGTYHLRMISDKGVVVYERTVHVR